MAATALIIDSLANVPDADFAGVPFRRVYYPIELEGVACEGLPAEEFIARVQATKAFPRTAALRAGDVVRAARNPSVT